MNEINYTTTTTEDSSNEGTLNQQKEIGEEIKSTNEGGQHDNMSNESNRGFSDDNGYLGDCSSDSATDIMNFKFNINANQKSDNLPIGENCSSTESLIGSNYDEDKIKFGVYNNQHSYNRFVVQQHQNDSSVAVKPFVNSNSRRVRRHTENDLTSSHTHHHHPYRLRKSGVNNTQSYSRMRHSQHQSNLRKLRLAANLNDTQKVRTILYENQLNNNEIDLVNLFDEYGRTTLHCASAKGYGDVVKILLNFGANPNIKDGQGNTPLHLAACTNHVDVVTLLLKAGTTLSPHMEDNSGRTPLQLAQSKLRLLQKNPQSRDISELKREVCQVLEMMREYCVMKRTSTSTTLESADLFVQSRKDVEIDRKSVESVEKCSSTSIDELLTTFSVRINQQCDKKDLVSTDVQCLLDSLHQLHINSNNSSI